MEVPVGLIIGGASKIAEYFGLIETVNTKITKLLHQQFHAAIRSMEDARYASGQTQVEYVKQARTEFNQAVAVEENENKILALVGLSLCQYMLGDSQNANRNLNQIRTVELTRAEKAKYSIAEAAGHVCGISFLPFDSLVERELYLGATKFMLLQKGQTLIY